MTTANPDLVTIVNTVNNVHGDNHPHLSEVKQTFTEINDRYDSLAAADAGEITPKLARLRELSNDYQTPADGCEGYQMMDSQLEEFEKDVLTRFGA